MQTFRRCDANLPQIQDPASAGTPRPAPFGCNTMKKIERTNSNEAEMKHIAHPAALATLAALATTLATPAAAYIGPGAGIGALGTVIALFGALAMLIVGFVWYPVKRMLKSRKSDDKADA